MPSQQPPNTGNRVARALGAHSALGVMTGAVLYILCLSGIIAVFVDELERLEQPDLPVVTTASPELVERAASNAVASGATDGSHHFTVRLPSPALPHLMLVTDTRTVYADADGNIAGDRAAPWTRFVLDLHYYLHLPSLVGISVVGVFGVLLLGLSMTGILAHPRIFRDAFTFRLRRGARLTHADIHNRLSVWTSPFHIVIAFTGTMIALSVVGSYVVAQSSFDGDRHAVFDTVFGPEPEEDETPAALPAIARALDAMARDFPEVEPTHVVIHNPATAGQDLQVLARHPDRLIFAEYYMFTGDGTFTDTVGLADGTLGQQLAASVYTIHFGSYGGTPIKVVYAILGLALTFIITSGIRIHLLRRRQQGFRTAPLEPVWAGIVWGVPGLLAVTLVLALTAPGSVPYLPLVFWGGLVVIVAGILTGTLVPRRSPGVFSKDGS